MNSYYVLLFINMYLDVKRMCMYKYQILHIHGYELEKIYLTSYSLVC
jgi:hypothetical protein